MKSGPLSDGNTGYVVVFLITDKVSRYSSCGIDILLLSIVR